MEPVEDLQLRPLARVPLFSPGQENGAEDINLLQKRIAASSKFGITIALVGVHRLLSWRNADVNGTSQVEGALSGKREIPYPFDEQGAVVSLDVSPDGVVLALSLNSSSGPFVELADVRCFSPSGTEQPFPLARVRLSSDSAAKMVCFEWNPSLPPYAFAAATSDNCLSSIEYLFENGSTFTVIGSRSFKDPLTCISWSPKGKQLTVGDAKGVIHQLKPDLSPLRAIEPPSPGAQCIALCWLSTTEWLVAHRLANSMAVSLLILKKQQPPLWSNYPNLNLSMLAVKGTPSVAFLPLLDWKMVFIYSTTSCSMEVIGVRREHWVHFQLEDYDVQLMEGKKETCPIACCLDMSSARSFEIGGSQLLPQPCLFIITALGSLLTYAVVSLDTQRPKLTRSIEVFRDVEARFGTTPAGYKPAMSRTIAPVPVASVAPMTPSRQPLMKPTPPSPVATTPAVAPTATFSTPAKKAESPEELQMKELARAKEQFKQAVAHYCEIRNAQTRRVDALRELCGKVEECASLVAQGDDTPDPLFKAIEDIQRSLADAVSDFEMQCARFLHSAELMSDVKILGSEGHSQRLVIPEQSCVSENRVGLLEKRYECLLDKLERAQKLVNGVRTARCPKEEKGGSSRELPTKQPIPTAKQQAEFNSMTGEIARRIQRLGAKLSHLQQQARVIGAVSRATGHPTSAIANGALGEVERCAEEMSKVLVVSRRANLRAPALCGAKELSTNRIISTASIRMKLMNAKNQPLIKVPSQFVPLPPTSIPWTSPTKAEESSPSDSAIANKLMEAICSPQRRNVPMVSVGTQSPEYKPTGRQLQQPQLPAGTPPSSRVLLKPAGSTSMTVRQQTKPTVERGTQPQIVPQASQKLLFDAAGAPPTATTTTLPATPKAVLNTATPIFIPPKPVLPPVTKPVEPPPETAKQEQGQMAQLTTPKVGVPTPPSSLLAAKAVTPEGAATAAAFTTSTPTSTADTAPAASMAGGGKTTLATVPAPTGVGEQKHISFSFKPPTPGAAVSPAPVTNANLPSTTAPAPDEGMMDEEATTTATSTPAAVSFSFKQTGLGSSVPQSQTSNAFGKFDLASKPQGASSNNWLFGGNIPAAPTTPASGGLFGTPTPPTSAAASPFGSSAFGSQTQQAGATNALFGQAKPAFGGGAVFGSKSPFGGAAANPGASSSSSLFGGGGSAASPIRGLFGSGFGGGGATTTPTAPQGFASFANKSSAFGQLAQTSPTTQQQTALFGGQTQQTGGFSSFGGASTSPASFGQATKSPAFTTMRR